MSVRDERWVALYFALTLSALIVVKVFFYADCFAFDSNDDANHTFVNLKAAQDTLRQGALPNVNLYNNFGTPLLGDALTYPFAIQATTYWFLPGYAAMTVNRFVIVFLTVLVACAFLRRYMSLVAALTCTMIVLFSPGFFWNVAHHHYQLSLLCACTLLYVQARHRDLSDVTYLLTLSVLYCVFLLSVSIQPVVLALPFVLLFLPVAEGRRSVRPLTMNVVALLAALIATWPHTAIFFSNLSDSTRLEFAPYAGILTTTRQQLLSLFVPPGEWMHYQINGHFSIVTYYSIAYLVFAVLGIVTLLRRTDRYQPLLRLILVLGVLPAVGAYVLQFYGQQIPFVRSVDSTRVWWFSNLFLAMAVGRLIDISAAVAFSRVFRALIAALAVAIVVVSLRLNELIPEFGGIAAIHHVVLWSTVLALLVIAVAPTIRPRFPVMRETVPRVVVIVALLIAQIPTLTLILGLDMTSCARGNHFFSYSREATFQPRRLLTFMQPGTRMASDESPVNGHELKAIFGGVLGSSGRAIVSSQRLMDILLQHKLVVSEANYYFSSPWKTDQLTRLGIRYLALTRPSRELEAQGWKVLDAEEGLQLYENPSKPSLVALLAGGRQVPLSTYQLVANGINVQLPDLQSNTRLLVTFFYRDRWHAWIDNRQVRPAMNELGMMEIPVAPGDHQVRLRYEGVTAAQFAAGVALAAGVLVSAWLVARRRRMEVRINAAK